LVYINMEDFFFFSSGYHIDIQLEYYDREHRRMIVLVLYIVITVTGFVPELDEQ